MSSVAGGRGLDERNFVRTCEKQNHGLQRDGNDYSVFRRYGSVAVALGRGISIQAAEVIDTNDLGALGRLAPCWRTARDGSWSILSQTPNEEPIFEDVGLGAPKNHCVFMANSLMLQEITEFVL